jgi:hypothetical protein
MNELWGALILHTTLPGSMDSLGKTTVSQVTFLKQSMASNHPSTEWSCSHVAALLVTVVLFAMNGGMAEFSSLHD